MSTGQPQDAKLPALLDAKGDPIQVNVQPKSRADNWDPKMAMKNWATYVGALFGLNLPPDLRSRDAFKNHPWVYTAVMARALNLAQAPFGIFRETEDVLDRRRRRGIERLNRKHPDKLALWNPPCGRERSAVQRHLTKAGNPGRFQGFKTRALELEIDNPLQMLLQRPNRGMTASAMWQITEIWMGIRGEAFWLLTGDDPGVPLRPGQIPTQIFVISPDLVREIKHGQRLVGWQISASRDIYSSEAAQQGSTLTVRLDELVQFKYVNPENPIRGLCPLTAAAMNINLDMQAMAHNRTLFTNGSNPGDMLVYDGELDKEERNDMQKEWEDRHKGAERGNRLGIIWGAWKYIPTGITPKDLDHIETLKWDRDAIFAVLRVPKSSAGITDQLNFATQLGQDRNFWDKGLLPEVRLFEDTIDNTLLFEEGDDVIGMFDLSGVEALRQGQAEQIEQAAKLAGQELHCPPRIAYDIVGLAVPEYPGDEIAFVAPTATTVASAIDASSFVDEPPTQPALPADEPEPSEDEEGIDARGVIAEALGINIKQNAGPKWEAFVAAQAGPEKLGKVQWKRWVREERRIQLERFDAAVDGTRSMEKLLKLVKQGDAINPDVVLTPVGQMSVRLGQRYRPVYAASLDAAYDTVIAETGGEASGVSVFEIDDPAIMEVFHDRARGLVGTAPQTIQNNLRRSLVEGITAGETFQELRERISSVYNVAGSPAKTKTVARTETAGFMNDARQQMFKLQGFKNFEWITAGDEVVRPSHDALGREKIQPEGTDWSKLEKFIAAGGNASGILLQPGDRSGPPSEVINCRCVLIPKRPPASSS